ncbi:MAG: alpha/beta fold hydrolase [Bryobacteraceae bacterium]|nr:alpha/beta fold hydrolase [Bryobacteraceae bacterium]
MSLKTFEAAGMRLAAYDAGSGPPLVLLHGQFGDHQDWWPVLQPLSREFRVFAVDLPGYGASAKPRRRYTAGFFVETLHELLQSAGIQHPILAGNSWGGSIAISYALRHPAQALVLVGSAGIRRYSAEELGAIYARLNPGYLAGMKPADARALFSQLFPVPSENSRRYIEKQAAMTLRPDYADYAAMLAQAIPLAHEYNLRDRLPEIPVPALILWGELDSRIPVENAHIAAASIPGARLEILPGAGHMPQIEAPEHFVRCLRSFASTLQK